MYVLSLLNVLVCIMAFSVIKSDGKNDIEDCKLDIVQFLSHLVAIRDHFTKATDNVTEIAKFYFGIV